jgi:hypothetical protein
MFNIFQKWSSLSILVISYARRIFVIEGERDEWADDWPASAVSRFLFGHIARELYIPYCSDTVRHAHWILTPLTESIQAQILTVLN